MSDDWDVGACALLAGIHTTAERFGLTHVEVVACVLCLQTETSPLLQNLRKMVYRQMQSFGLETAADNFGIPAEVVKIICRSMDNVPPLAPKPSPRKSLSPKPRPPKPLAAAPGRPVLPPFHANKPDPLLLAFRRKVRLLYDLKVRIRVISALFGVSSDLVHSWGDFSRLQSPDKHLLQRSALQDKLAHGSSIREAAKSMKMRIASAETLLGLCPEFELARRLPESRRLEAVSQVAASPEQLTAIAKRFNVAKETLQRWAKGDFSLEEAGNQYIREDEGMDVATKRKCLEEYYITGEAGRAAASTSCSIEQVKAVISDFEGQISGKRLKADPQA